MAKVNVVTRLKELRVRLNSGEIDQQTFDQEKKMLFSNRESGADAPAPAVEHTPVELPIQTPLPEVPDVEAVAKEAVQQVHEVHEIPLAEEETAPEGEGETRSGDSNSIPTLGEEEPEQVTTVETVSDGRTQEPPEQPAVKPPSQPPLDDPSADVPTTRLVVPVSEESRVDSSGVAAEDAPIPSEPAAEGPPVEKEEKRPISSTGPAFGAAAVISEQSAVKPPSQPPPGDHKTHAPTGPTVPQVPVAHSESRDIGPAPPGTANPGIKALLIGLGVVAILIVVGIGGWLMLRGGGSPEVASSTGSATGRESQAAVQPPETTALRPTPTQVPSPEPQIQEHSGGLPSSEAVVVEEPGSLKVNWRPWAEVEIDGYAQQTTPCAFNGLEPGTYTVWLSHPTFGDERRSVTIQSGQQAVLIGEFQVPGKLNVNAMPWAEVWVNGENKGNTPLSLELPPGRYTVTLDKAGNQSDRVEYEVEIKPNSTEKIVHRY